MNEETKFKFHAKTKLKVRHKLICYLIEMMMRLQFVRFKDITNIRYCIAKTNQKAEKKRAPVKMSKENEALWRKTIEECKKHAKK